MISSFHRFLLVVVLMNVFMCRRHHLVYMTSYKYTYTIYYDDYELVYLLISMHTCCRSRTITHTSIVVSITTA